MRLCGHTCLVGRAEAFVAAQHCSLIISQGATGRMATAVQADGVSQTLKWQDGVIPPGTANTIEIVSFTFIRVSDTWTVVGTASSYS